MPCFGVKKTVAKRGYKQRHNDDKPNHAGFDHVLGRFQAIEASLLVQHGSAQVRNPDALLFVFGALGNVFAGRHY